MEPRFVVIGEKKLVGKCLTMSFANNRTMELWKSFMPLRRQITHVLSDDLISMQLYQPEYFTDFNPARDFEKWAVVEVAGFEQMSDDFQAFTLPGGLYAVFNYKGLSSDNKIFKYILETWLPASGYALDHRPHFEVLGAKYKNNDPSSEEEIWIPVREK